MGLLPLPHDLVELVLELLLLHHVLAIIEDGSLLYACYHPIVFAFRRGRLEYEPSLKLEEQLLELREQDGVHDVHIVDHANQPHNA